MNKQIENIKKTRLYLLEQVKDLSVDQLNDVPAGFKNNIVWNLGHLVAAQQGLCYIRSGLQPTLDEKDIAPYRPGTKPEQYLNDAGIILLKDRMFSSLEQFEKDFKNNFFVNYGAFTTRYGVELTSIQDALEFLPFHEGVHSGTIMALKKLVSL